MANIKLTKKQAIYLCLSLVIISIISLLVNSYYYQHEDKFKLDQKERFIKAVISGKIYSIYNAKGDLYIRLENDSSEYFLPYTRNAKYAPQQLMYFLAVGDSLYKPSNTNLLKIVHNNKEYEWFLNWP